MVDLRSGPPPIPPELVEYLEVVFPDRLPTLGPDGSMAEIHRALGKVEVVRFLRDHLTRQQLPLPRPGSPKSRKKRSSA